jgi:hypothetical protein
MRAIIVIFAILVPFAHSAAAATSGRDRISHWDESSKVAVDHTAWGVFLSKHLDTAHPDGVTRVRYAKVGATDQRLLNNYIQSLARIDPVKLNKKEAFAYWVNLYNALTVRLILDHYPVNSIRDIRPSVFAFSPWKQQLVTVAGEKLSLDHIEHGLLRTHWKEPRVHYVINCASIGCPNLPERPLTGTALNMQLDRAARAFINHERGVHFDTKGRLIASSIYKWFSEDFGESEARILAHLRRYARPALNERLRTVRRIDRYEYDWTLNDSDR